jgi:hypothetical protein
MRRALRAEGEAVSQTFVLHGNDRNRPNVVANFCAFVRELDPAKAFKLTVETYRKTRSDEQNGALFGVAYPPLMDHMGLQGDEDKRQLHWFFCGEFFGWIETPIGRKPLRTTTKDETGKRATLDTAKFAEFYNFVQRKAASLGVFVPDPDPLHGKRR